MTVPNVTSRSQDVFLWMQSAAYSEEIMVWVESVMLVADWATEGGLNVESYLNHIVDRG